MTDQKIAVLLHTWAFCGDHSPDICRALDVPPETTIGDLCARVLTDQPGERIELRLVERLP